MRIILHPTSLRSAGALALLLTLPAGALARPQGPSGGSDGTFVVDEARIGAVTASHAIRIDGEITPSEWRGAPVITEFTARNPVEGATPSQRTEVRILYDAHRLYVAFTCHDDEPDGIVYRVSTRDSWLLQSDKIQVDIDPYHDRRNAYHFIVTVANTQTDTYGMDINWDGVWDSATRITPTGWNVELAIPFTVLRFEPQAEHVFGINFGRTIQRTKEDLNWQAWARDDWLRVDKYGTLEQLRGLRGGGNLEVMPYAKASRERYHRSGTADLGYERDGLGDIGLDLKYNLSSNMALDVALNPDFGQIAPDAEQINVTRYERYYHELRPFFQEGQSIFRAPLQIFYSRRIGKQPPGGGPEANLMAGAKLIGRTGPWQIGLINALTERRDYSLEYAGSAYEGTLPMADFTVVRAQRDILDRSTVGVLAASKDSRTGTDYLGRTVAPYQRTLGLDTHLRSADNHYLTGMIARSLNHGPGGDDWGGEISAGLRSDLWEYGAKFTYLGPELDVNQIGYITQVDRRRGGFNVGWKPRPEAWGIRRIELKASADASRNFAGEYTYGRYRFEGTVQGMNYMQLEVQAGRSDSRWRDVYAPQPWATSETARVYQGWDYQLKFSTDGSLDYSFSATVNWGDFLDYGDYYRGRDLSVRAGFSFRPSARFSGSLNLTHIREYHPGGILDETKNLLVSRLSYYFTSAVAVKLYNQFRLYTVNDANIPDSGANTLNVVFSWFINAKSILYVVYNEIRDDAIADRAYYERYGALPLSDRALLVKLTYWFDF